MKFLILALFSFFADVEVWALNCWNANYFECLEKSTNKEISDCVKLKEKTFDRAQCVDADHCVLVLGTFTDESRIQLRFCGGVDHDCKEVQGNITQHKTKPLKQLQCTFCYEDYCNEELYILEGFLGPYPSQQWEKALKKKSKKSSGIQNHKFPNIFILVTIAIIILSAF